MASSAGNKTLSNAGNTATNNANAAGNIAGAATNIANSEVNTNGGLSPLVGKQLANEAGQINKAYAGAAQGAQRGLSMRGMGSAPTGLEASIRNTGINNAGQAITGATGNAFGEQSRLNNTAYAQPLSALGVGNSAAQVGGEIGKNQNQEGTIAGNIGAGLTGLSGVAKNVLPFTGLGS